MNAIAHLLIKQTKNLVWVCSSADGGGGGGGGT